MDTSSPVSRVIVVGGKAQPYGAWACMWEPGSDTFNVHLWIMGVIDPLPSKIFTHHGDGDDQPPTLAQAVNIMSEWIEIGELTQ